MHQLSHSTTFKLNCCQNQVITQPHQCIDRVRTFSQNIHKNKSKSNLTIPPFCEVSQIGNLNSKTTTVKPGNMASGATTIKAAPDFNPFKMITESNQIYYSTNTIKWSSSSSVGSVDLYQMPDYASMNPA